MKSIPNLEMPPASSPVAKGDGTAVDKLELSGEGQPTAGLADMCILTALSSEPVTTGAPVGQQDHVLLSDGSPWFSRQSFATRPDDPILSPKPM